MDWDKFKVAQKFLQKANAIHPEDAERSDLHDKALATQDIYYDCYMSSFSKEDLIKRLREIVGGNIELPEETKVDEVRYRETYTEQAKAILDALENGQFKI